MRFAFRKGGQFLAIPFISSIPFAAAPPPLAHKCHRPPPHSTPPFPHSTPKFNRSMYIACGLHHCVLPFPMRRRSSPTSEPTSPRSAPWSRERNASTSSRPCFQSLTASLAAPEKSSSFPSITCRLFCKIPGVGYPECLYGTRGWGYPASSSRSDLSFQTADYTRSTVEGPNRAMSPSSIAFLPRAESRGTPPESVSPLATAFTTIRALTPLSTAFTQNNRGLGSPTKKSTFIL
jgi:hypothetical protein